MLLQHQHRVSSHPHTSIRSGSCATVLPASTRGTQLSSAKSLATTLSAPTPQASTSSSQQTSYHGDSGSHRSMRAGRRTVAVRANLIDQLVYAEGYTEVEQVKGVRMVLDDAGTPQFEYLIQWKDGGDMTWEAGNNLSEDLIRDYEERWWGAARKADLDTLMGMLEVGREVLASAVDENRRSALHFAAGLGSVDCAKLLIEAGADLNTQDREGYTPLHMAAGYMHTSIITLLVEAGADPELRDNKGQSVVRLIEGLRGAMPLNMATVQRRLALEEVANTLTDRLYDEVEPARILDVRPTAGGAREFLVAFDDGRDDEWVSERDVGAQILADFESGIEYANVSRVIDVVQVGLERRFKVEWTDGYPTSWEAEEHLPEDLIALFQAQNPELFAERTDAAAAAGRAWSSDYETQFASRSQPGTSSSSSSSNGDVLSSAPAQPANDQEHTSNGHGSSSSSSSNGAVAMAVHQGQDAAGAGVPTAAGAAAAAAGNGSGGLAGHSGMEGCTGMEGSVAAVAGSSSATAEQKVAAMV